MTTPGEISADEVRATLAGETDELDPLNRAIVEILRVLVAIIDRVNALDGNALTQLERLTNLVNELVGSFGALSDRVTMLERERGDRS